MSRLVVEGLNAGYEGRPVIRDLDLDLPSGQVHAILGPSGCGKTTLLRCLAGLKVPDGGRILVDGHDVARVPAWERGIVLLHQENSLFPHLDVGRNVGFGLRLRGTGGTAAQARVERLLDLVGLPGLERRRVHELSGGQRQRVALARALAVSPRILLLDEPLSHLDEPLRLGLRGEIRRILREADATAYYVTHDREEALAVADGLVLLDGGRLVDAGAPRRVFEKPSSPHAARILGRRNLLPFTRNDDGTLRTPVGDVPADTAPPRSGTLMIEETDVRFSGQGPGPEATVASVEYLGGRYSVRLRAAGSEVWADANEADGIGPGSVVRVDVSRARPFVWPEAPGPAGP